MLFLLFFFSIKQGRYVRRAACTHISGIILNRIVSNWTYCFMPGLMLSSLNLYRQHFPGFPQSIRIVKQRD